MPGTALALGINKGTRDQSTVLRFSRHFRFPSFFFPSTCFSSRNTRTRGLTSFQERQMGLHGIGPLTFIALFGLFSATRTRATLALRWHKSEPRAQSSARHSPS